MHGDDTTAGAGCAATFINQGLVDSDGRGQFAAAGAVQQAETHNPMAEREQDFDERAEE
eukprot:COSAG01_NODE_1853_length_9060_cov_13.741576_16_plen_59_part_00